ncbi:TolC family protein [soil metagenome]
MNNNMKKLFFITVMFLAAASLRAQVKANDDLKNLIRQSFGYFPRVKEVENTISTAQEKLEIAQTNLPTVEGTVSYDFVQPKISIPFPINGETKDFQFAATHNVDASVGASYMLFDFGRIKANVEKAKADLKYAQHNVDYAKSQLAYQVTIIYYNIIYYQKAIQIEDSVLVYLNENKRIINSKLANGDAIRIDILNVQAGIDAEENRKVDLQNSLQKQLNLLSYTTGNVTSPGNAFDFDVMLKDAITAMTDAQTNNLEYVLAKDRVQQAQKDLAIINATDNPSVNIGANTGLKNGYIPNINTIRFNYNAGATLRIPIYDGGKTKRQEKVATTIVKQNQLAIETLDNTYRKDIQQALTDLNSNMERIKNTVGQIEVAKVAESLAASRYQNGVGTNLEITNASTNSQRAAFTRLQYEYQLCLAKVELARLLGYQYW